MNDFILDASALLALLHKEQGSTKVSEMLIERCAMSSVNLAEVVSKQSDIGVPVDTAMSFIQLLGIHIYDFDSEYATIVGTLRQETKNYGLSLGDRACLALGLKLDTPVVTADRAWSQLDLGVEIIQIR